MAAGILQVEEASSQAIKELAEELGAIVPQNLQLPQRWPIVRDVLLRCGAWPFPCASGH